MSEQEGFNTRAIHVGQGPDPTTGATIPPLYLTSTFTQKSLGVNQGYEYGRGDNPTRQTLEKVLASLELGRGAVAFSSGMAACDAVLRRLGPGDVVVAAEDLYGGVFRLLERVYRPVQIDVRYVDAQNLDQVAQVMACQPKLLWMETPSNPLLQVVDIAAIASIAHQYQAQLVVDNTFASPYNQNPLKLGADMVVHSTTKYIGGHSDAIGGAVVARDEGILEQLKFIRNAAGATLSPFDAWLTLRGLKTLGLRMQRHAHNAQAVASFLREHPLVEYVYYPGFLLGMDGEIARRQMRTFGGMVSFTLKISPDEESATVVDQFLRRFRWFSLAESLGGVESLVGHPASMTHAAIPAEERARRGIADSLIRLSVGIEEEGDLIGDLRDALSGVGAR